MQHQQQLEGGYRQDKNDNGSHAIQMQGSASLLKGPHGLTELHADWWAHIFLSATLFPDL